MAGNKKPKAKYPALLLTKSDCGARARFYNASLGSLIGRPRLIGQTLRMRMRLLHGSLTKSMGRLTLDW